MLGWKYLFYQQSHNTFQLRNWFCFRWREVLTSSKPGPMAQMSALTEKYPEVAKVRKSLFHFFISYASSFLWNIFRPPTMTSRRPVMPFSLWFHYFEDDFIQHPTLLLSLSSSWWPLSPLPSQSSPHRIDIADPIGSFDQIISFSYLNQRLGNIQHFYYSVKGNSSKAICSGCNNDKESMMNTYRSRWVGACNSHTKPMSQHFTDWSIFSTYFFCERKAVPD